MTREREPSVSGPRDWAAPRSSDGVVVLAASAGGLRALTAVLAGLPADFPAAVVVVQHRGEGGEDLLPALLGRDTALRVRAARDGDVLEAGTVYVCPPGKHAVTERSLRLVAGPPLDHVRPSADALLASAARTHGGRAVGVVLSGDGADGARGCLAVARAGGVVVAQEPASAAHPAMPAAAAERGGAQHVAPLGEIAALLVELVGGSGAAPAGPCGGAGPRAAPIRVVLADDHRLILEGLRTLLDAEPDIDVVGEAEDGAAAIRAARELRPDVVVLDINMPSTDGIAAARRIRDERPETQVVVLSAYVDVRRAADVLAAGAVGCLLKDAAYAELATAIRQAAAGRPYFSARVAPLFARRPAPPRG